MFDWTRKQPKQAMGCMATTTIDCYFHKKNSAKNIDQFKPEQNQHS